jgi:hypothetical protein
VSSKGAVGPYQFMQKFLPDFGYGMPKNIPLADVQDPTKARSLADRFITGYSDYHQFKTPLQKLVAYNAGPGFAAQWIASGEDISQLPTETQQYITRAAGYLANQNTPTNNTTQGNQQMAVTDYPESRRLGATPAEIDNARRRGVEDQGLAAILEVRRNTRTAEEIAPMPYPTLMGDEMGGSRVSYNTGQPPAAAGGAISAPPPIANVQSQPPAALSQAVRNAPPYPVLMGDEMGGAGVETPYPVLMGDEMGGSRTFTPYPTMMGDEMGGSRTAVTPTAPGMLGDELGGARSRSAFQFSQPGRTPVTAVPPTRNRRDMTNMSMVPPPSQIGLNEALIRIGGAGVRGASQGGLNAFGAMTDTYGAIQDANRATGLAQYQAQMEALASGKDTKDGEADQDTMNRIGQIDEALFDMDRAMGFLTQEGASVTGLLDSTLFAAFDRATGNPDRARRLLLEKLRVDDALLRIAQTKGAISNKEMDLFLAPAPSMYDDESTWVTWITDRQKALRAVRSRLATGSTAAEAASASQLDRFSGDYSEADAIAGFST